MAPDSTLPAIDEIAISASAARRIAALIAAEGGDDPLRLRVSVSGGGCSGFQYGFSLDNQQNDDDRIIERDGVGGLIDEVSRRVVERIAARFGQDLIGSYFVVKNPNASSTCGCGSSFAL